jgi:Zn-dependent peptidase ImmA (M78 family)
MSMMRNRKPTFDRRALANRAMQAAIATRAKATVDQHSPVCIYGLCATLGVVVRFNNINMEGMYQRAAPPRIHLSARRPLPRRAYNCAHELGHHVFGHGSSIDELREDAKEHPWEDPKEFLADTFAGFTLMPIMGLRRAFAVRGWKPETATPVQMFTIACDFGIGYSTLLTHLSVGVNMISRARADTLQRATPKAIRAEILGSLTPEPLIVADYRRAGPTLDAEEKMLLLLPPGTETTGSSLTFERDLPDGRLFRTVRPGIVQASADSGAWATFVRIAPEAYVGLAQYRHLEDDPDE